MKCSPKCEWQIQPPWGELSLTSWGNPRASPVFLVHGRQDCAATFQPLLELLDPEEFYYVSIDMPGSGNSTPLPVEPQSTSTDYSTCLQIEVPEEPASLEDQEVTLILARDHLHQDAANHNVPTSINYTARPKVKPSMYWHCNDCVVLQMEERDHIELVNLLNVKSFYSLLHKIQIEEAEIRNATTVNDDGRTVSTDIRSGQINRVQLTPAPKSHDHVGYYEICPEIRRIFNENVIDQYRILAKPEYYSDNATLTMGNATICRSSQKRKRGMKLRKIPNDSIVCNDHGGRPCRFAKPANPTEKDFFLRGYKKPIMKRYLQNRLARGWAGDFYFSWGPMVQMVAENQDDRVSDRDDISALSPITEYTVESDSNSPTDCELFDCPHLPVGLLRDLHNFYKNRQLSNYTERPAVVPYANDVQRSPTIARNWDLPSIYETSPQQYSYISEIHNYARRPEANPWANDTDLLPVRRNPHPYDMPSMYDLIPQKDTSAPVSKLYNPGDITRTTSILSPEGSSNYGAVALPGLYTPIGTAPGYDYEYMYPGRDTPELDQYRPNCLIPWAYSNPFTPMSYDRFVPCPQLSNGLPSCFVYDEERPQEAIPSEAQEKHKEDFNLTTEDSYNTEVAEASGNNQEEARVYRDPGRGSGKTWSI